MGLMTIQNSGLNIVEDARKNIAAVGRVIEAGNGIGAIIAVCDDMEKLQGLQAEIALTRVEARYAAIARVIFADDYTRLLRAQACIERTMVLMKDAATTLAQKSYLVNGLMTWEGLAKAVNSRILEVVAGAAVAAAGAPAAG